MTAELLLLISLPILCFLILYLGLRKHKMSYLTFKTKFFYGLIPFVPLVILLACNNEEEEVVEPIPLEEQTYQYDDDIILKGTTLVLDDTSQVKLENIEIDSSSRQQRILLMGNSERLQDIRPGFVLMSGITSKTPIGLMQKVVRVEQTANGIIAITEPASLTDAIDSCSINFSKTLSQSDILPVSDGEVLGDSVERLEDSNGRLEQLGFSYKTKRAINVNLDDISVSGGPISVGSINLEAILTSGITLNGDIDIDDGKLKYLNFQTELSRNVDIKLSADVALTADKNIELLKKEFPIVSFRLKKIRAHPLITLNPVLKLVLTLSGSLKAKVELSYSFSGSVETGISYDETQGWDGNFKPSFDANAGVIPNLELEAKTALIPKLDLEINGVAGFFLENAADIFNDDEPEKQIIGASFGEAYVRFSSTPNDNPCWKIAYNVVPGIGVHTNLIGFDLGAQITFDSTPETVIVSGECVDPEPIADFEVIGASGVETDNEIIGSSYNRIYFANKSKNADSYKWQILEEPWWSSQEVDYSWVTSKLGIYNIRLEANGPGGSSVITKKIRIRDFRGVIEYSPETPIVNTPIRFSINEEALDNWYKGLSNRREGFGGIHSIKWIDESNGNILSTEKSPTISFDNSGNYQIELHITGSDSLYINRYNLRDEIIDSVAFAVREYRERAVIEVKKPAPTANFTFTPESPDAFQEIQFTSETTNTTDFVWSSTPSGFNSTEENPTHTFELAGTYQINLKAIGQGGDTTITKEIIVNDLTPEASFTTNPALPFVNQEVQLVSTLENVEKLEWTSEPDIFTSTEPNPKVTFEAEGVYQITLKATSLTGTETTVTQPIYVSKVLDFTYSPEVVVAGEPVQFTSTVSFPNSYEWVSESEGFISEEANPTHTFDEEGTYQVSLKATNIFGTEFNISKEIEVQEPTKADFTFSPEVPIVGVDVQFTSTVTNAESFMWSSEPAGYESTEPNPTFNFSEAGSYQITLVVTGDGGEDKVTKTVKVETLTVSDFSIGVEQPKVDEEVQFTSNSTNATSYLWTSVPNVFTSTDSIFTHAFTEPGTYEVTLKTTGPGGEDMITKTIKVEYSGEPIPTTGLNKADDEFAVVIELVDINTNIPFNQEGINSGSPEYDLEIDLNLDNNPNTGNPEGYDTRIRIIYFDNQDGKENPPQLGTIIDFPIKDTWSLSTDENGFEKSIAVNNLRFEYNSENNTIYLYGKKKWEELNGLQQGTIFKVSSFYNTFVNSKFSGNTISGFIRDSISENTIPNKVNDPEGDILINGLPAGENTQETSTDFSFIDLISVQIIL